MKQGTYSADSFGDNSPASYLEGAVSFYGGFAGNETDIGQRDIQRHATILTNASATTPAFIILHDGITVDGFAVEGWNNTSSAGGAFEVAGNNTVISNCVVANCQATDGGGLFVDSVSSCTISHCAFVGNQATSGAGGAISNLSNQPVLIDACRIVGNSTSSTGIGGGIYSELPG